MRSLSYLLSVVDKIDVQILATTLDTATCQGFVTDPICGGINIFVGTTRQWNKGEEITKLDFECYEAMAEKIMHEIAKERVPIWKKEYTTNGDYWVNARP